MKTKSFYHGGTESTEDWVQAATFIILLSVLSVPPW